MRILRSIMFAWMLIWLAGGSSLASAVPFCKHGNVNPQQHAAGLAQQHANQHLHHVQIPDGPLHCIGNANDHSPDQSLGFFCNNCDLCHIAVSFLPPENSSQSLQIDNTDYQSISLAAFSSRFPDKPLRIPLSQPA